MDVERTNTYTLKTTNKIKRTKEVNVMKENSL